jgi:hypothetical protein
LQESVHTRDLGAVCRLFAVVVAIKFNFETLVLSDCFCSFAFLREILRTLASWSWVWEQHDKLVFGISDDGMVITMSEVCESRPLGCMSWVGHLTVQQSDSWFLCGVWSVVWDVPSTPLRKWPRKWEILNWNSCSSLSVSWLADGCPLEAVLTPNFSYK